ncbi:hypothetical protein N9U55_01205 [Luminiphilus sp.]|nr:N,N-dimethylformamidase beta subunit family domain-containing protein [Luminiphilus sp.]MDA9721878.1 hypothetical protein [Luminiphilus sp.]
MSDEKTTTVLEDNPARNAWTILDRSGQIEFPSEKTSATEIWGYTNSMSYLPCDTLKLHVHTSAAKFNVVIYRDGFKRVDVYEDKGVSGSRQKTPRNAFEAGCDWEETLSIKIPNEWQSGLYIIELSVEDAAGNRIQREAFFVLRSSHPGDVNKLAIVLTTASYTAYNDWGGG